MDAAAARMAKLKDRQNEENVLTATCRMKLFQAPMNFATALDKVKASSARAAVSKERHAVTAKYEELRSCAELRMGFANSKTVCLKANSFKMMQKRNASVA